MSASLLQKSLKLFEETRESKRKSSKKTKQQQSKRKKYLQTIRHIKEHHLEDNIANNLEKLNKLNTYIPPEISEKIFSRAVKSQDTIKLDSKQAKQEEATVFSEEDFEKFEKEYFAS